MPTCPVCLDLNVPPLEALDYGLRIKVEKLLETAAGGCTSCRLLRDVVKRVGWTAVDGDMLDCYNVTKGSPLGVSILHADTRTRQSIELYATPSDPSPWRCIGLAHDLPSRLSLEHCAVIASKWLTDCSRHVECPSQEPSLPTRLVAIHPSGRSVKLIEPAAGFISDYVPLSHRWGAQTMVKTTKSNFQQQCSEILFTSLPATFRDAIDLLHALGIGYAWVDSLCIIQDDLEDWNREAARMSQVYMNGLFTIAADNAPDSSYGLFLAGTQRRISIGCLYGNVHIRPVGERQLTSAAHTLVPHRWTKATASALSSRGWVFQERVLSNRTLHFTESEMAWECGSELQCECEVNATPISSTSFRSGYIESQHNSSLHLRWLVAVTDFSMRSITYPSYGLPALAGLAAVTSNNSRGRYAAGLWSAEPQFLHGLLWMAGYIDRLEQVVPFDVLRSDRQPPCYAPSWSWASITGCVNFIGSEFDQEQHALIMDARVMEVDSASKGLNPYGPVSDGNVTLVGALAEVRVVGKSPDQDPPNQIRHGMRRWEIISSGLLQDADIPAAASWMPRNSPSPFKIGSASVLDGYHILDGAYMDVDDGVEVDMHARHYFLLIGYYDFRSDPLRGQRADFDKLNEDTSPFGLLLRRQEDGTYYRIGLVVSRLRVEGVAVWKKLAVVQSVTIYTRMCSMDIS